jgi:multidrug transporter EmrE-like cation transporter
MGAYALFSTAAILLVKQFVPPALAAWRVAPGMSAPMALVALGASLYVVSFLLWMAILSRNELSVVYPVLIGVTLALTTLAAWLLFKESIPMLRLAGIGLIFFGVVLVTRT